MSKIFITFGNNIYLHAVRRIVNQAKNLKLFNNIYGYSENDLKNDEYFWKTHSDFILSNPRGFGYWLWKSYLIMKTMEKMNENDILLYCDCGCEIDYNKHLLITNMFELVKTDLIIGTSYPDIEKNWNKMDTIIYLNMVDSEKLNTYQHQAGVCCYLKCEKTYNLVKEWYNISCNYHLLDDSPSINNNFNCFIEHRHDQSIFSLLTKKYNIYSNTSLENIIEISRNRTGISQIENNKCIIIFYSSININKLIKRNILIATNLVDKSIKIYIFDVNNILNNNLQQKILSYTPLLNITFYKITDENTILNGKQVIKKIIINN